MLIGSACSGRDAFATILVSEGGRWRLVRGSWASMIRCRWRRGVVGAPGVTMTARSIDEVAVGRSGSIGRGAGRQLLSSWPLQPPYRSGRDFSYGLTIRAAIPESRLRPLVTVASRGSCTTWSGIPGQEQESTVVVLPHHARQRVCRGRPRRRVCSR